jgi:hypothetical protein
MSTPLHFLRSQIYYDNFPPSDPSKWVSARGRSNIRKIQLQATASLFKPSEGLKSDNLALRPFELGEQAHCSLIIVHDCWALAIGTSVWGTFVHIIIIENKSIYSRILCSLGITLSLYALYVEHQTSRIEAGIDETPFEALCNIDAILGASCR